MQVMWCKRRNDQAYNKCIKSIRVDMTGWEILCIGNRARSLNLTIRTNPEFVPENKMHKILWDFEIQTDHLILSRRPDLVIVNKKENSPNSGLSSSG